MRLAQRIGVAILPRGPKMDQRRRNSDRLVKVIVSHNGRNNLSVIHRTRGRFFQAHHVRCAIQMG